MLPSCPLTFSCFVQPPLCSCCWTDNHWLVTTVTTKCVQTYCRLYILPFAISSQHTCLQLDKPNKHSKESGPFCVSSALATSSFCFVALNCSPIGQSLSPNESLRVNCCDAKVNNAIQSCELTPTKTASDA